MNVQFFFGGTSLLIVVGVAMDTVQQVESQLIMRHYDGFMKKTPHPRASRDSRPWRFNVIMLGPPGAGKGTQAERFARGRAASRRFRPATCCARRCRPAASSGWRAKAIMDRGELVSDEVMIGIVTRAAGAPGRARAGSCSTGFRARSRRREALDALMVGRDPLIVLDIVGAGGRAGAPAGVRGWSARSCGTNADGRADDDLAMRASCVRRPLMQRADDNDDGGARAAEGLSRARRSRWSITTGRGRRSARSTARSRPTRWPRDLAAAMRLGSRRRRPCGADAVIVCRSAAELEQMRDGRTAGRRGADGAGRARWRRA